MVLSSRRFLLTATLALSIYTLLRQVRMAREAGARRRRAPADAPPPDNAMVDEVVDETFPASDPAPWWSGGGR
jgi:hypothetical protein